MKGVESTKQVRIQRFIKPQITRKAGIFRYFPTFIRAVFAGFRPQLGNLVGLYKVFQALNTPSFTPSKQPFSFFHSQNNRYLCPIQHATLDLNSTKKPPQGRLFFETKFLIVCGWFAPITFAPRKRLKWGSVPGFRGCKGNRARQIADVKD